MWPCHKYRKLSEDADIRECLFVLFHLFFVKDFTYLFGRERAVLFQFSSLEKKNESKVEAK